ncbi:structural protein, partial [Escherichia coli]|nr:structural protein [Escherichia coli]
MTTYATGNPLGSKDPRDLYDNAENFDAAMNDRVNTTWNDRFGVSRPTMKGYEEQFNDWLDAQGFEPGFLVYVDGSPLTVDRPTQLIQRGDNIYSVKRPASFPVKLTGNWATDQNLLVAQVDRTLQDT